MGIAVSDFILHKVENGLYSSDPLCETTRVKNMLIICTARVCVYPAIDTSCHCVYVLAARRIGRLTPFAERDRALISNIQS